MRAPSYEALLAKTRWPLCSAPHAPSVPPTERGVQKRANPNPAATRSARSPANKWCLFASSLFVKTLGSCLSSRVRFRVMNPRSRCRQACSALLSASPEPCPAPANLAAPVRETVANCCVFARTVAWSWPTKNEQLQTVVSLAEQKFAIIYPITMRIADYLTFSDKVANSLNASV